MNQSCKYFSDLIHEYLDNTLKADQKILLEEHFKKCPHCYKELKEIKETIRSIKTLRSLEIPNCSENFANDIVTQLNTQQPIKRIPKVSYFKYIAASTITAILIGIIALGTYKKMPNISTKSTNAVKVATTTNIESEELGFESLFYENDSILADSGIPLDEWGLIDVNGL